MLDRIFINFSLVFLALLTFVVLFAGFIQPHDPLAQNFLTRSAPPSTEYWLGTDSLGRDIFSRIIEGARLSMIIGIASPLIAAVIGITMGTTAAYFGGWIERVITRITDVMMSFDPLLLGVLIVALLGPGLQNLAVAIAFALVPSFIRLSRGSTLAVRQEAYVDAAIAMGRGTAGTIVRHVLPNISGPLIVMTTIWVGTAIRLEATLSFIGLGAQPPTPSWGNIVRMGVSDIFGSPLPALFAGLAITLTVLSFNVLGDALRDWLDPDRKSG
ncbi:ABC transporter permease [Hoeflea prorocentri]|uniref:ABC transporter permease n=1 Tax=Hoeflea prorocentri TaxID=1922333 RepID=A0A9X3UMQ5_9HYPH|nr:ABC transporter permease [Hoeflea prorocentri]MCY6381906.1 ABC transporter permease [Hoeflea prorocentri]MDA5399706.1 ABC transporter permease [Hoeflea prorocentri]